MVVVLAVADVDSCCRLDTFHTTQYRARAQGPPFGDEVQLALQVTMGINRFLLTDCRASPCVHGPTAAQYVRRVTSYSHIPCRPDDDTFEPDQYDTLEPNLISLRE